jgi:hypothetical protein
MSFAFSATAALTASTENCSRGWVGGEIFWQASCFQMLVAKKLQRPSSSPLNATIAAINLRMAAMALTGTRVPPPVNKVPTVRRRLPVTILPATEQPVIIRHVLLNVDSLISETQPSQSPRV